MKAILMSIRPQWVAKILNGEKTIEIRKRFPKDFVGWVYIYCTKEDSLSRLKDYPNDRYVCEQNFKCEDFPKLDSGYEGKGKVVARFWCDKVDKVHLRFEKYCAGELSQDGLLKYACLTEQELDNYLWSNCCIGCAIHITKLKIFDKPKEISEFFTHKMLGCEGCCEYCDNQKCRLTRAPQSWCYVEALNNE